MKYRINPRNGDKVSALGFGCLHMPEPAVSEQLIMHAYENGVNYYDTAYIYMNCKGERRLGDILKRNNIRKDVYIATKMPTFLVRKTGDLDRFFDAELKSLQTDYVDYYLMHMLSDIVTWERLCALGVEDWIARKKQSGQIRNIGFSFHGGKLDFTQLIDAYDWEMSQIQYNYMDENNQAGKSGLEYSTQKDIPVVIMEPLRGGRLVNALPKDVYQTFEQAEPKRKPADWALRWIWNHEQPMSVLSGMRTIQELQENLVAAQEMEPGMLTQSELAMFDDIKRSIFEKTKVPCTGCGYCMPCPFGVDIPNCFSCYNDMYLQSPRKARSQYMQTTAALTANPSYASKCTGCGKCETMCPQHIPIRDRLADVSREMEKFPFRQAMWIARKFSKER